MFVRRLIVALAMVLLLAPGAVLAQTAAPANPELVMLSQSQLPAGFTRDVSGDKSDSGAGFVLALRQFKDVNSVIQLVVISTTSSEIASDQANGLLMSLGSQSVNFPMDDENVVPDIGEGAVVGWSDPDANDLVISAVVFKSGNIAGGVIWIHPDDDDDNTEIIDMARAMGEKAKTAR